MELRIKQLGANNAFQIRNIDGTSNFVQYNSSTNATEFLSTISNQSNANSSIILSSYSQYTFSNLTYYPNEIYGFSSVIDIPNGNSNTINLTGAHVFRNLTFKANNQGIYFSTQTPINIVFRNCIFKPEDGINVTAFCTIGNIITTFIDCDLRNCSVQTTDDIGVFYITGNTLTDNNTYIDGVQIIDKRANTVFANTTTSFPTVGNTTSLYVSTRYSKIYRWTGTLYQELSALTIAQTTGNSGTNPMSQAATTTALGLIPQKNISGAALVTPGDSGSMMNFSSSNNIEYTLYSEANTTTIVGNHYYIRQIGTGIITVYPRVPNGLSVPAPTLTTIGCNNYTTGINTILHLIKIGPGDNWIMTPYYTDSVWTQFGNPGSNNRSASPLVLSGLGTNCTDNQVGSSNPDLVFGNSCIANTVGSKNGSVVFGNSCAYNSVGNRALAISIGDFCRSNIINSDVNSINLGNSVSYCEVKSGSNNIAIGNNSSYIAVGEGSNYISIGVGCARIQIYNTKGSSSASFIIPDNTTDCVYRNGVKTSYQ